MESEWNRNATGKEKKYIKFTGVNITWNGIELEWKWNGTFTTKNVYSKYKRKWNGNRMVMEWKING